MFDFKTPLLIVAMLAGTAVSADQGGFGGPRGERPTFEELDTDGSGGLSAAELRAPALDRFAAADTDGDGGLSAEEMAAMAEARSADRAERMFERMLARRDANEDGLIQFDELANAPRPQNMFERVDTDADGTISAEEFEQAKGRMADRRGGHGMGRGDARGDRG